MQADSERKKGVPKMIRSTHWRCVVCVLGGVVSVSHAAAEKDKPLWTPAKDEVYLQEVGQKVAMPKPARCVAVHDSKIYVGSGTGLAVLDGDKLVPLDEPKGSVSRLKSLKGALWVIADSGLHRNRRGMWTKLADARVADICLYGSDVIVAAGRSLSRVRGDALVKLPKGDARMPILRVASYSESIYCLGPGGRLAIFMGNGFDTHNPVADFGRMPSTVARDLLAQGSRLYIATDRGLALLRGMALTTIKGADGLCYEDTTCLTVGFARDLWIGTREGAIRSVDGEYQYFAAGRWLPNNQVNDIAVGDRVVCVATDGGLGIITYEPYTLRKKAAYYERHLEEWGQKRLGFIHKLEWDGPTKSWMREVSDNDCGYSCEYLSAMCFKYAVTGDEAARKEAINTFTSLKWAEEATPMPGFPARSMWANGETGHKAQHGSGGLPAEWHDTADGKFEWKGDTSSDETDAHFHAVSIFHDLIGDEKQKKLATEHLSRIATHMIDNGWVLRDLDGEPTRWARWDPEYLQRPYGYYARGLNGMEILAYMRAAYALTGDAKFEKAYQKLLDMKYHHEVLRQKLVFPPDNIIHFDDRLAFYTYYTLLTREKDPFLRSIYRRSLERSWEIERMEHIPWFNFIYGALTGNDCEVAQAVGHLREWPLDLRSHSFRNTVRHDLHTPEGYVSYAGGVKAISPRVRGPMRWDGAILRLDGGAGGRAIVDPTGWMCAYWMGRYYGMIGPPATDDPKLTKVEKRGLSLGAAPYAGPPRPPVGQ